MPVAKARFTAADSHEYQYESELGTGGQAVVWRVFRVKDGQPMALKLFKNPPSGSALAKQQERLKRILQISKDIAGALPESVLCYPRAIHASGGEFGVLMEIATGKPLDHATLLVNPHDQPQNFVSNALQGVMKGGTKYHHFLLSGFHLCRALRLVHRHGMTHCDLSLGNVFFCSDTGRMSLIDCDNLACGANYLPANVAGTPGFRAPELITAANPTPRPETDLHSLAVLLFYLFLFRHPFIGNTGDDWNISFKSEEEAFGKQAIFTDHPKVKKNRFNGGIPFSSLPQSLQKLFTQAFTDGMTSPEKRPTAANWSQEIWNGLECMAQCTSCGQRYFLSDRDFTCLFCGRKNPSKRWRIKFSNGGVMLAAHGRKLYEHHLDKIEFQFQRPMAEIKETEQGMTLKNLSDVPWTVRLTSGAAKSCGQGFAFKFEGVKSFSFRDGEAFIEQVTDKV
jgi:DNA-binding helix-hairpin-helix protein with protein kinase domain